MRIATILSAGKAKRSYPNRVPVFQFTRDDDNWTVVGLRGHVLNLDYPEEFNHWKETDLKELIWVKPVKKVTAANIERTVAELSKDVDEVVIATDYDREGELIGTEALDIVRRVAPNIRTRRARFSALTKWDIEEAFNNLVDVDYSLAQAAETRQVVDLAWGAVLTRFLSLASGQTGRNFLSVGRVQSPALALIVDREREIEEFVAAPYWKVIATFEKGQTFQGEHEKGQFWVKTEAEDALRQATQCKEATVVDYVHNEREERPPVPFNTTIFLTEANKLGLGAAHAMRVAEDLYQSGWISYPRTDNTVYPSTLNLRAVLKKLEDSEFAKEASEIAAQPTLRPTRGRSETTDHPPIYPVQGATKAKIKGDGWKIYELVTRRFLATLAPGCLVSVSEAKLDANTQIFIAQGYVIREPGWRKYYPYYKVRESSLPTLTQGEKVKLLGVDMREDETEPPPRYSQGTLIQEMERLGLGTKSTRHEIIQKLYDRKFIEGRRIRSTLSGRAVVEALEEHADRITKPEMTAHLEDDMDEIARGVRKGEEVVEESQSMLEEVVEVLQNNKEAIATEIKAALQQQNYVGKCNQCKEGDLMIMRSPRGVRFLGCSRYPQCMNRHPLPQNGIILAAQENCPECGSPLIKRLSGGRTEVFCVDSECPTVKEKNFIGKCDKCRTGDLMIRHSARGKRFIGCSNYPDCDNSNPLPQRGLILPTEDRCPACNSPIIRVITKGRKPWTLCVNMKCPTKGGNKKGRRTVRRKAVAEESKAPA